jgi:hypothetical protein
LHFHYFSISCNDSHTFSSKVALVGFLGVVFGLSGAACDGLCCGVEPLEGGVLSCFMLGVVCGEAVEGRLGGVAMLAACRLLSVIVLVVISLENG